MKKNLFFARGVEGYVAPSLEMLEMEVEQGFIGSFGDTGEAGDSYDENDNGGF